jgi:hypothetical protein
MKEIEKDITSKQDENNNRLERLIYFSDDIEFALTFLKGAENTDFFKEVIKISNKLNESYKNIIVELATKLDKALENNLEIIPVGELKFDKENKFIMGLFEKDNQFFITWSNCDLCKYHIDIYKKLKEQENRIIDENSLTGGKIFINENGNKLTVEFFGDSAKYGNYSKGVLKSYQEELIEKFSEESGKKEIELINN